MKEGFQLPGELRKVYPIVVKSFICDAPARALIKGITQFNGTFGCDHCEVEGTYQNHRMLFHGVGPQRTDERFRKQTNKGHHNSDSILCELEIDMIKQFPIEPMHCVDLGVARRMLCMWKTGPKPHKLSEGQLSILSVQHCSFQSFFPRDFNRKPRSLKDLNMWKATEFRTFLLYTGPIILRGILPSHKYDHFMCLSCAMRILYSAKLTSDYKSYAHQLLECFIDNACVLYCDQLLTYNFHCLLHLADIAEQNQSLQSITAYPFENNMGSIKRLINGPSKPLVQVARRLLARRFRRPATKTMTGMPRKDECYELQNGQFALIHSIEKESQRVFAEIFPTLVNLFEKPCESRVVGIYRADTSPMRTKMAHLCFKDLKSRALCIPLSLMKPDEVNSAAVISLLHT